MIRQTQLLVYVIKESVPTHSPTHRPQSRHRPIDLKLGIQFPVGPH